MQIFLYKEDDRGIQPKRPTDQDQLAAIDCRSESLYGGKDLYSGVSRNFFGGGELSSWYSIFVGREEN